MNQQDPGRFDANSPAVEKLRRRVRNPWLLRAFMLRKLPMGLLAGLKITEIDEQACAVSVPYNWLNTNPFRSTYFAVLAMAAEMSSGALGLGVVEAAPEKVSMLIVGMEAEFVKKASSVTTFRCEAGKAMADAVIETLRTGESVTVKVPTVGTNREGQIVARFTFTWSFKKKQRR